MDINSFDTAFVDYLGDALISRFPAYETFDGRGGYVYVFKFNNNAYRVLADSDNDELIFQVLSVGYPASNGGFGYDDAHDYGYLSGQSDEWLSYIEQWVDECESDDPYYTQYEGDTNIMSSKGGANMQFRFNPKRKITAAEEEKARTLEEIVDEKCDNIEDDFDYIISGIDRLCREDRCQDAIQVLDTVAEALDNAIASIGDLIAEDSGNLEE